MKKLIATLAIVGAMFGAGAAFAPSASAHTDQELSDLGHTAFKVTYALMNLLF